MSVMRKCRPTGEDALHTNTKNKERQAATHTQSMQGGHNSYKLTKSSLILVMNQKLAV